MSESVDRINEEMTRAKEYARRRALMNEAAPDMLEALEEALMWLDGWLLPKNAGFWDGDQYIAAQYSASKARAAVSKAKGESK